MERFQEIERSIITTYRKDIWHPFCQALNEYQLIEANDHIMVCISGGKDSFLLAKCLQEVQRHGKIPFNLRFVVMDPGYKEKNLDLIKTNAEILNIPIEIFETRIFDVATSQSSGAPCYLCARMRRGALYSKAKEIGCNKIALGHHFDDVIETTLMSMFYGGEIRTMIPKLHSENFKGIDLIRPLYQIHENSIINWSKHNDLTFINCACRFTEKVNDDAMSSKRKEMKKLIKTLTDENRFVESNIFKSMTNVNLDCVLGYIKDDKRRSFLDDFNETKMKD